MSVQTRRLARRLVPGPSGARLRYGTVTATATSPNTVTVDGIAMPYSENYATPAVDDKVAYLIDGRRGFVLGQKA